MNPLSVLHPCQRHRAPLIGIHTCCSWVALHKVMAGVHCSAPWRSTPQDGLYLAAQLENPGCLSLVASELEGFEQSSSLHSCVGFGWIAVVAQHVSSLLQASHNRLGRVAGPHRSWLRPRRSLWAQLGAQSRSLPLRCSQHWQQARQHLRQEYACLPFRRPPPHHHQRWIFKGWPHGPSCLWGPPQS